MHISPSLNASIDEALSGKLDKEHLDEYLNFLRDLSLGRAIIMPRAVFEVPQLPLDYPIKGLFHGSVMMALPGYPEWVMGAQMNPPSDKYAGIWLLGASPEGYCLGFGPFGSYTMEGQKIEPGVSSLNGQTPVLLSDGLEPKAVLLNVGFAPNPQAEAERIKPILQLAYASHARRFDTKPGT